MDIKEIKDWKKQLVKWSNDNDDVHFINLDNGQRLVVFNPDRFIWNAYGKESIDTENELTDEQWLDFKSNEDYLYLQMDDDQYFFEQLLQKYCENNGIKTGLQS